MKQFATLTMRLSSLVLAVGLVGGCVSQKHADDLDTVNRTVRQQVVDLQARIKELEDRIVGLQGELENQEQNRAQIAALRAERDRLQEALAQAGDALRNASFQGPVLPAELDQALVDLAASDPNLMSYDAQLGMVKFQSDLTFGLGSVDVSSAAQDRLKQLASILSRSVASGYEARIVGHTDNVPIRRQQTLANHPTNWHLSVHRAIAVKDVLQSAGVPATRLSVAGYGEHRPIAANSNSGNERNRRVEIYLTPSTHRSAVEPAASEPSAADELDGLGDTTAPAPRPENPANFK